MMLHITHNDLDGAGCSVLVKKFLQPDFTVYLNYDEIDNFIINNYQRYNKIIITDLSPSIEVAKFLSESVDVLFIDHHITSEHLIPFFDSVHDTSKSGTLLTFEWLKKNGYSCDSYKIFAEVVNDYDMWHLKIEESLKFNMLFSLLGIDRFVGRFQQNPSVQFDSGENLLLEIEEELKDKYLKNGLKNTDMFTDRQGRNFAVIFAEKYNSELGHYIVNNTGASYVFIINAQKKKISLRSRSGIDISEIAVKNGGGGHKNAAGFSTVFDFGLAEFLKSAGVIS